VPVASLVAVQKYYNIAIACASCVSPVNIALNYNISAYDAAYVALSQQTKTTLLTLDKKLVKALANSAYSICLFNEFTIPPLPSV
jgi:predicted nucleic acid-binding protein